MKVRRATGSAATSSPGPDLSADEGLRDAWDAHAGELHGWARRALGDPAPPTRSCRRPSCVPGGLRTGTTPASRCGRGCSPSCAISSSTRRGPASAARCPRLPRSTSAGRTARPSWTRRWTAGWSRRPCVGSARARRGAARDVPAWPELHLRRCRARHPRGDGAQPGLLRPARACASPWKRWGGSDEAPVPGAPRGARALPARSARPAGGAADRGAGRRLPRVHRGGARAAPGGRGAGADEQCRGADPGRDTDTATPGGVRRRAEHRASRTGAAPWPVVAGGRRGSRRGAGRGHRRDRRRRPRRLRRTGAGTPWSGRARHAAAPCARSATGVRRSA